MLKEINDMTRFRLWMIAVLTLMFSLIVSVPNEAMTGKNLGITKKEYIKAYNQQLTRLFGMRFEKSKDSTKWDTYTLSDNSAILMLQANGSGNIEEIGISVTNLENRQVKNQHIAILNIGAAIAIKPDSTEDIIVKTIDRFSRKFMDKFNEGLSEFSFEMSNKNFTVSIMGAGSAIVLNIKPL